MHKIRYVLRQLLTGSTVLLLVGMLPAPVVMADSAPATTDAANTAQTESSTPANGPSGPDAATYNYNAVTGLWENDHFTYNPSTKVTVPKDKMVYTYNNQTGMWDTSIWQYDGSAGYIQAPLSVATPPEGAETVGGPTVVENAGASTESTEAVVPQTQTPNTAGDTSSSSSTVTSPSPTGPYHHDGDSTGSTTTAGMTNNLGSTALSGNSLAQDNRSVGNVGTGDASATTTVVNLLQSQSSLAGSGVATFTANIQGNVTGDFLIDPASFGQNSTADPSKLTNAQINNVTNGYITNNINLAATSGNATADNNYNVTGVTTGDANAIANVVNMINSVVAANQSFIGTINIYGDYSGNILMPADSLNALLGSTGNVANGSSNTTNNMSAAINNNVDLAAASGNVSAIDNRNVGNVSSGDALTNLTILNLTGHQVVAANSLLVFVNVLGNWVGLILDAPAGSTSAALAGGVSSNGVYPGSSQISNTGNFGITNNITAAATSGDALAANNHNVGAVGSGNATASANIANLVNSSFSLSNWFGILFINVFGTWHGNFGVASAPVAVPPITSGASGPASGGPTSQITDMRVFAFVPRANTTSAAGGSGFSGGGLSLKPLAQFVTTNGGASSSATHSSDKARKTGGVLGSTTHNGPTANGSSVSQDIGQGMNYWSILFITLGAAGFGVVGIERVRSNLRRRPTATTSLT